MTLITPEKFKKALDIIKQADEVAIDTETYWTASYFGKRIIGVSVYGEAEGKYFNGYFPFRHDWSNQENLAENYFGILAQALNEVPHHTFHNAKFDRSRFLLEGFNLTSPFFCTMVASHMVDENSSHELEDLAEHYQIDLLANKRKQHIHDVREKIVWHAIPPEIMVPYACGDTRNTHYLKRRLVPKLEKQELHNLWPTEELYSDCLMHMELVGIDIDRDMAEHMAHEATMRMIAIKKELSFDPAKPLPLALMLFKKLGLPIYEIGKPSKQFPQGRPKMDEPMFQRWEKDAKTPEAKTTMALVLEFRGLQKARSTWYEGWVNLADDSGKLHPQFSQHGTVTTRLSSSKPNVQQIPREAEDAAPVKKLLRAPVGYELWQADYSQIEYRLAGVLSGDPVILDAYRAGKDMHSATGERLNLPRQGAKTTNFLFIYEGGPARWADVFDRPLHEAKLVYAGYHQLYNVMFNFASKVNNTAQQRGWIRLWDGRRRHFKFTFETKKAWNSYVQGGAARIMIQAMINIHQDKTLLSKMNSQVHDAIWTLIPSYAVHTEIQKLTHHLEWPSRDKRFLIPFPVEWTRLA